MERAQRRCLFCTPAAELRRERPSEEARLAAHGLASLIDGWWLRAALSRQPLNLETARTLTTQFNRQQRAGAEPHEKEE
ncbi:TetR family transcriptional regulator C-terminal domain-containing protein [Cronobacter sakazakii]|nr:TetR family transcriptional regulator C-terminal domain-containing protein [Cronobacter sakazakii]